MTPWIPWNNPVAHKLEGTDLVDRRLDGSQSKLSHSCSEGKLVNVPYDKYTHDCDKVVDAFLKDPISSLHMVNVISTGDTSTKVIVI